MKKLLLIALLFSSVTALAQKGSLSGRVTDSISGNPLDFATLSLIRAKDSTLLEFTQADTAGKFRFTGITPGTYLISASYSGYQPAWKQLDIHPGPNEVSMHMIDVGMAAVVVQAKRPPVTFNKDTLEFNTEHFKTPPNAVVEELLKRLPGITIDPDGTVRMNGRPINKVLVNGKEFFSGDPKMATKNLNADIVDKVQLFEKASEQAEFTGIDDGKSETTLNLKLKKDRNNAIFGRATAGTGPEGKHEGQLNVNSFSDERQVSLLGMASNTNKQGFSTYDLLSFTGELGNRINAGKGSAINITYGGLENSLPNLSQGQNQQGVSESIMGGVNFNDTWNSGKTKMNGSFIWVDVKQFTDKRVEREYLYPNNHYNFFQQSKTYSKLQQKRSNFTIEHRFDSFHSLKLSPRLGFQNLSNENYSGYHSLSQQNAPMNEGNGAEAALNNSNTWGNNLLFRKRFKKRGRTISASLDFLYNEGNVEASYKNSFTTFNGITRHDSLMAFQNLQPTHAQSWKGSLVYTEPYGRRSLLEFSASMNTDISEINKGVHNFNSLSGKYDLPNMALTNHFRSEYDYYSGGFAFRTNQSWGNASVGASLQSTLFDGRTFSAQAHTQKQFTHLLPHAVVQLKMKRGGNLSLNYSASIQQPNLQQLQPVTDVSNPLNIITGNPELQPAYLHNFTANLLSIRRVSGRSLFAFASVSKTKHAIAYLDEISATGVRKARPINVDGVWNAYSNINTGYPLKSINSRVDLALGGNYNRNVGFINGVQNIMTSYSISPMVKWRYTLESKLELMGSARIYSYNVDYSLQKQAANHYYLHQYQAEAVCYLPYKFILNSNLTYTKNTGRNDGFNRGFNVLNATLSRTLLKDNKLELKYAMHNILNAALGQKRTTSSTYIEDLQYNVLGRFSIISAVYSFNKSTLKK